MKRSPIDALITEKTLSFMSTANSSEVLEYTLENSETPELKNLCTKVHPELAKRIDNLCNNLDIRKRQFCEYAFIEAVEKAEKIIQDEGLIEYLSEIQDQSKKMKGVEKASSEKQEELSL